MNYKVDKKIIVLSTMSAGKSTLINALIGKDVFPSSNEACTAKIMTFTSDKNFKGIKAHIYGRFDADYENLKKQDIEILNSHEEFKRVDFYGSIDSDLNKNVNVKFIDTPGVNNSQDLSHAQITYKALEEEEFDTILYILNATQLGVYDDALLLAKLKGYIERNKYTDVIFVLNKIDEIDTDKESLNDIYINAIRYISKNTNINNPQIVCTSAYYANLIKKEARNEKMTRKELRDINSFKDCNEQYNKFTNLEYINNNIKNNILHKTGILNLEHTLFNKKKFSKINI